MLRWRLIKRRLRSEKSVHGFPTLNTNPKGFRLTPKKPGLERR